MVKIGLTLGGGGAKGIAHIKFLKVFDELGIKPKFISGTSIGAIIGAMYSSGMSAIEIEHYFKKMDLKKVMRLLDFSWSAKSGLFRGKKLTTELKSLMNCTNFKQLKIPLFVFATDFYAQEEVVFSKGNILDALRASSSIPGIFQPVSFKKKVLVDGGVINPLPYEILKKKCDVVIAIDVMSDDSKIKSNKNSPNVTDQILQSLKLMQSAIIQNMLEKSEPDLYLNPSMGDIEVLDFHKSNLIISTDFSEVNKLRKYLKKLMNSSTFRRKVK